jgi:hypothetical protein
LGSHESNVVAQGYFFKSVKDFFASKDSSELKLKIWHHYVDGAFIVWK